MEEAGVKTLPPHQILYNRNKENIDKMVEESFDHIQWHGLDHGYFMKSPNTTFITQLNTTWHVVTIIGIEERPNAKNLRLPPEHTCHQFDYLWKVVTYFLNAKSGKAKNGGLLTRKDKQRLQNLMQMMFFPVGEAGVRPSHSWHKGMLIGYKMCAEEDYPVIETAKIQLVKEFEATQAAEACAKCSGQETRYHAKDCPNRKTRKKKNVNEAERTDNQV